MEYISTFEELAEIAAIFVGFIALTSALATTNEKYRPLIKLTEFYMLLSALMVMFFALGAIILMANGYLNPMAWKAIILLYCFMFLWSRTDAYSSIKKLPEDLKKKVDKKTLMSTNANLILDFLVAASVVFNFGIFTPEGGFLVILWLGLLNATVLFTSLVMRRGSRANSKKS